MLKAEIRDQASAKQLSKLADLEKLLKQPNEYGHFGSYVN